MKNQANYWLSIRTDFWLIIGRIPFPSVYYYLLGQKETFCKEEKNTNVNELYFM